MKTNKRFAAKAALAVATAWLLFCVDQATAADTIPLCPGLTIVTAVSAATGDYESIKKITSASDTEVHLNFSAEAKNSDIFSTVTTLRKLNIGRTMLVKDLQSATDYEQTFMENSDETIPGTTSIGTSAAVLDNLKQKGVSKFGYSNAFAGLTLTANRKKYPNYYSYIQRGVIRRVPGPATYSVIVNDVPTELPVVHAEGTVFGEKVAFTFLDDPANPLTLAFRVGVGAIKPLLPEQLQYCATLAKAGQAPPSVLHCNMPQGGDRDVLSVVELEYPCKAPAGSGLEKALANKQKVDLYSIYFSFNSDALRDESTPTLKDIADILTRHPDWRLAVSGHTDSVGGDAPNLDLSKRRAPAVVNELIARYHVDGKRLKSAGYGKSQPKDTNDTLEGRARNRRVELMRF